MGTSAGAGNGGRVPGRTPRQIRVSVLYWMLAFLLTVTAAAYQELTGPTHPLRGHVSLAGHSVRYSLPRSHHGPGGAVVSVPSPTPEAGGLVRYRRAKTDDPFSVLAMQREEGRLTATLPHQPPAGHLEYVVELASGDETVHIPSARTAVIRFVGAVSPGALIPHILLMFIAMLLGVRAGLEAVADGSRLRWKGWATLSALVAGGMVMGPLVQKQAFGAYWTGVPFGWDLTDNKVLVSVLVWIAACWVLGWRRGPVRPLARFLSAAAAVVTLAVFTIPHSLQGSELDYSKLDQGAGPRAGVQGPSNPEAAASLPPE
jgi:hypothetical protein